MSKAFVAGATGYTGREVVRALVARGVAASAHVRPDSPQLDALTREFAAEGAAVDITSWDDAALSATLTRLRPNVVFALLGTTRARVHAARQAGAPSESYESVDYGLTAMLLRAAIACGSRPRFVYLSSLGAGRPSGNAYLSARHKAEGEVSASGLPYVIARPSFITGPDRRESRPGERIAAKVTDRVLALAGHLGAASLRDRYVSMSARTLARALVAFAFDEAESELVVETEELRRRGASEPRNSATA
jgi:nucleoside-diphosphate-sugar epimerase